MHLDIPKIKKQGHNIMIKYHNNLNQIAFSGFTTRELNLFFSICSILKEKGGLEVTIPFFVIEQIQGSDFSSKAEFVQYLRSTNKKLLRLITGREEIKGIYVDFVLFTVFKTDTINNQLVVKINEEFLYLLNELTKNFTIFELQEFNSLSSKYSKNLFRLLKQWKSVGRYDISVEEFRRLLDIPKWYRMSEINKHILKPIFEEVPQHFKNFAMKKIKTGKAITHLEFAFEPQTNSINKDVEQKILCPVCGEKIEEIRTKNGRCFYGHRNYKTSSCQITYSNIDEVNAVKKRQEQYQKMLAEVETELEEKADNEENIENTKFYQERLKRKRKNNR